MTALLAAFNRTIQDEEGNVMPGATVLVQRMSDLGLPVLRADELGNGNVGNPATADLNGFVRFYVASGKYRITASVGAASVIWEDYLIGTIQQYQADVSPRPVQPTTGQTYYIRPDGNDVDNDGLSDNAAGAWLTFNGASARLRRIDFNGAQPSIVVRPRLTPYAPGVFAHPWVGCSFPNLLGLTAIAITGAANNGSGAIRLAVTSTTQLLNGQQIMVREVLGAVEANNNNTAPVTPAVWTISIIDSTHIDLVGSTFGGAWTSGGKVVATLATVTGNSQSIFFNTDNNILGVREMGLYNGGFAGVIAFNNSQGAVLDPGEITYGPLSVQKISTSNGAGINEQLKCYTIGNCAAANQVFDNGRIAMFPTHYVRGNLTIDFFINVQRGGVFTTSGVAVTFDGAGAGAGTVGQKYIVTPGGVLAGSGTVFPGTIAGQDFNVSGPGASVTSGALVKYTDTGGINQGPASAAEVAAIAGSAFTFGFRNHLHNGDFRVAGRGAGPFTSATAFINNDAVTLLDRWRILSDGNNVVDVSQGTANPPADGQFFHRFNVKTANLKFGMCQVLERRNINGLIGQTLTVSFKAKATGSSLNDLRAAIVAWSSTADATQTDPISTWNAAGTNPTLKSNYTYENTPVNLNPTTAWATYSVSALMDTASTTNMMVLIWSDKTATTVADLMDITDIQLEVGSVATPFERRPMSTEQIICQRYLPSWPAGQLSGWFGLGQISGNNSGGWTLAYYCPPRVVPTGFAISAASDFAGLDGTSTLRTFSTLTFNTATGVVLQFNGVVAGTPFVAGNASAIYGLNANAYIVGTGAEL